ncbi:MAG: DUF3108 domain-containing protein [Nitrospirota bacterium]
MKYLLNIATLAVLRNLVVLCILALGFAPLSVFGEEAPAAVALPPHILAFHPGETLTYNVSWSNILTAGTAVMEVKGETTPDGKRVLQFIVTGHSTGLVGSVFPVTDTARSVFDPLLMHSLSYSLREHYGKKDRLRVVVFDREQRTVISTLNNDPPATLDVPEQVQDALSSLYYLRTREDLEPGKTIIIDVLDSEKNWSVEFQVLGREKLKTALGEFSTIVVRTFPKYKGVFRNKGEVFIWLTDDSRKVPVLMKSKLSVGSFVLTLAEMKL